MNLIKQLREARKITQVELAKRIGMSKGNLSQIEKGTIGTSQDNLKKIAEVLECSVGQLLGEVSITSDIVYNIRYYSDIEDIFKNQEYDFINVSDKLLKLLRISDYKNLVISKSNEKNMEPIISKNDFMIIDLNKKDIANNKIYLIYELEKLKIKRIQRLSPFDTTVTIKSENEIDGEYPPYTVSIEKAKEMILGQVVFYGRSIL